jgi:hypothetical protein
MEISNNNGATVAKFDTSQNIIVKSAMFLYGKIHEYTWISPNGKPYNQTDHIPIYGGWHLSIPDGLIILGS